MLAVLHLHATALRSLCLQLDSGWEKHHKTWGTLGKMVNLTQLQLLFGWKVGVRLGQHAACGKTPGIIHAAHQSDILQ